MEERRVCPQCQSWFETHLKTKVYCTWTCKEKAKKIRNRKRHPEAARAQAKRWRDNLSVEKKRELRKAAELRATGWSSELIAQTHAEQKGLCAICKVSPKRGLVPDHDHKAKKKRGLLCHNCNAGIGFFADNPAIALQAAAYLQKWRKDQ
jgi:hypothetical protein